MEETERRTLIIIVILYMILVGTLIILGLSAVSAIYSGESTQVDLSSFYNITDYYLIGNTSAILISVDNFTANITIPGDYDPGTFSLIVSGYSYSSPSPVMVVYEDNGGGGYLPKKKVTTNTTTTPPTNQTIIPLNNPINTSDLNITDIKDTVVSIFHWWYILIALGVVLIIVLITIPIVNRQNSQFQDDGVER